MELLVFCAGKADKTWPGPAADRPLRTRGKRQAQKIGAALAMAGLRPDRCLAEPGARALVSAQKALKAGGQAADKIETWNPKSSLPHIPGRVLLVLRPKTARAVLRSLSVPTQTGPGTLIHLQWDGTTAKVQQIIQPDTLPDLFPYPAPNGPERRERPAYYYTQSAAVPVRGDGDTLEILIVKSSSGRHWVVPKGIVEPGLSPAASAAVEAFEEAGVLGQIDDTPIGAYTSEKWGATCNVTVFVMRVTKVLNDADWQERHRTRRWVSQAQAASLLNQPQLSALVASL